MKKGIFSVLAMLFLLLFIAVCITKFIDKKTNSEEMLDDHRDTVESTDRIFKDKSYECGESISEAVQIRNKGFEGGVLGNTEEYFESDNKVNGIGVKWKEKESVDTSNCEDNILEDEAKVEENKSSEEEITENNADPIKENVYHGDLIELPSVSSDGVL